MYLFFHAVFFNIWTGQTSAGVISWLLPIPVELLLPIRQSTSLISPSIYCPPMIYYDSILNDFFVLFFNCVSPTSELADLLMAIEMVSFTFGSPRAPIVYLIMNHSFLDILLALGELSAIQLSFSFFLSFFFSFFLSFFLSFLLQWFRSLREKWWPTGSSILPLVLFRLLLLISLSLSLILMF